MGEEITDPRTVAAVNLFIAHGWPTCDICKQKVSELAVNYMPLIGKLEVTANCHGESEKIEVTDEMMSNEDFSFAGIAFKQQKELT